MACDLNDILVFSYEGLMYRLAEPIVERFVGKIKRYLQSLKRDSGIMRTNEDSGLLNAWDEFCVDVQTDYYFFHKAYNSLVKLKINELLDKCSKDEIIILWTQTDEYKNWVDGPIIYTGYDYNDALKSLSSSNDICEYLLNKLEYEADGYTTCRIDNFLYLYWRV